MRWKYILLLVALYFIYLLIGAAVFLALEFAHEERTCSETLDEIQAAFDKVTSNISGNTSFTGTDLRNLIRVIREAPANGVQFNSNQTPSCSHNWNYHNALFFAGTVITTIGYGNISPRTSGGQTFCIFYAVLGIPLFGIMFSAIGDKFAKLFEHVNKKLESKVERRRLRKLIVVLITATALVLFFGIIPAFIFTAVETWTFHEAFYYSFITLTTIGFGDFVAGSNADKDYGSIYRVGVLFWILFGLAFMATVISLSSDAIKEKADKRTNKKLDDDEEGNPQVHANDDAMFETTAEVGRTKADSVNGANSTEAPEVS